MFAAMSLWLTFSGSMPLKSVEYIHWEEYYYTDAETGEIYYTEAYAYEEPSSYFNSRYMDITVGASLETWGPVSLDPSFTYTIYESGEHFGTVGVTLSLTRTTVVEEPKPVPESDPDPAVIEEDIDSIYTGE